MKNQVLYFTKPNEVAVLEESIPKPKPHEVLIKTLVSGISCGTEMLFYRGLMPALLSLDETIPSLRQPMKHPFKYGYCTVGVVMEAGSTELKPLLNQRVFVFNPHEQYFCTSPDQLLPLPEEISTQDALFIPNMETAVNLILDGAPLLGEKVLILGLGIVGLLTTALLQQFPLNTLLGMDLYEKRRLCAKDLGSHDTLDAEQWTQWKNHLHSIDLIYELTGNPEALNRAIDFAAFEGRIVLGSWYGKKSCAIDLGGHFHRNRIKIFSSQVSTIASELLGRWSRSRRFDVVFKMLEKIKPHRFISHHFPIGKAHEAYQLLDTQPNEALFIHLTYED